MRDQRGEPVPKASVALAAEGAASDPSRAESEFNGCFSLLASAKKGQPRFVLTIRAPGYKELRATILRNERLTGLVTLREVGAPGESTLVPVPAARESEDYEATCLPPPVPGASSLGIR